MIRDMARVVTSEDLRARLGRELDTLKKDVIYVSRRGRLAGVLVDVDQYSDLIERLDFLEDSLAALQGREDAAVSVPWSEVRG